MSEQLPFNFVKQETSKDVLDESLEFHKQNPIVYSMFFRICKNALDENITIGSERLFTRLKYELCANEETQNLGAKLQNKFRKFYMHTLVLDKPEYQNLFFKNELEI